MRNDPSFELFNETAPGPWTLLCDHATNRVPEDIGSLGLPDEDMARHIAYDIGAAGVTRHLATLLNSPAVLSDFSRLVIDPNRGAADPTLVRQLYDRTIIPGNRHVDAAEIARRTAAHYTPYDNAIATLAARQPDGPLCSIHSFTPQLRGSTPRPWEIGVLFGQDTRLSDALIALLQAEGDLTVGLNQPYAGYLPDDTMDRHGTRHGRLHVLIEVRQDLIETPAGQTAWAERLAPLLAQALADATA